jgi:hypothetical protein
LLFPDTSPRGAGIEGEDADWDFGTGAGFYLNATNPKYSKHYNMLTHITLELPQVIEAAGIPIVMFTSFKWMLAPWNSSHKDFKRQSIFGHSMGGHGALTLYLVSRTKQYRSASAFAPISNPTKCPWGEKAFKGYLQGGIEEAQDQYDATHLIEKSKDPVHILIDYVILFSAISPSESWLVVSRAQAIIFINKVNFFQRIFWRLLAMLGTMSFKCECEVKKDMTTAITLSVQPTIFRPVSDFRGFFQISTFASDHIHCTWLASFLFPSLIYHQQSMPTFWKLDYSLNLGPKWYVVWLYSYSHSS